MRMRALLPFILTSGLLVSAANAQPKPPSIDLSTAPARKAAVDAKRLEEDADKARAEAVVQALGGPLRGMTADGQFFELIALENGRPVYFITQNSNAAISTAADQVRNTAPYSVNGFGHTVGVWDGGSVRATHQEFGTRVNVINAVATSYHATHVAGTIGAAGVVANAQGMAPNVTIDSYDWTNDESEMSGRGATFPGEAGTIYLSNHSYGLVTGWVTGSWSGSYGPHWWGVWGQAEDQDFGRYDTSYAQDWDVICYAAPYYLPFKSSGNDRNDAPPGSGTTFYYINGGWQSKAYVVGSDPAGDGTANPQAGYDTIGRRGVAKNIMTVGAVNDAVSGGRSVAAGTMASFSGWGPTDDGRIKPDIVANGVDLYSCDDDHDADYYTMGGTSMSTPNATGSAALLVDLYGDAFPGQAMRSSMLKGLIIHTADDPPMSNAGPDYAFGWGLMDTEAAADQILDHSQYPSDGYMRDGTLNGANPLDSYSFDWDGASPIRATLCWTDPAGPGQSGLDDATPMLVNDLDLRVYGPGGVPTYAPYVLSLANPGNAATTGDNTVDNVEQVYIASPGTAGTYSAEIAHKGTLTNGQQVYSLLLSGLLPDALQVTPSSGYDAAGPMGGPFAPASKGYTLTNTGGVALNWTAGVTQAWVQVNQASGALAPGNSTVLTVSVNANANALAAGTHNDTLAITNTANGKVKNCGITLEVRDVDEFVWNAVSSPQLLNQPFSTTVTAIDTVGATVTGFTDTVDLSAYTGSPYSATIAITEIDVESPDAIEIQNVSGQAVNTTGWVVAVSDNYGNINLVNAVEWGLPASMPSGQVLYRTDTAGDNYWGSNLYWDDSGTGWAMIVDDTGAIIDFVAWNWLTADIAAMNPTVNGFSISIGTEWTGDGFVAQAVTNSMQRQGNADSNDTSDWVWLSPMSFGSQNAGLITPFPGAMTPFSISPIISTAFVSGVWTGDITPLETGTGVHLRAEDSGSHLGDSNAFDVFAPPTIIGVTSGHANGNFTTGETIVVEVLFTEAVTVTGTPTLDLDVGTPNGTIDNTGGSGTDTLSFTYNAGAGDGTGDLDYTTVNALVLNGGSIRDTTTNALDAVLTLPAPGTSGSLGDNKAIVIDTEAPNAVCQNITVSLSSPTIVPGDIDGGSTDNVAITAWTINGGSDQTYACGDVASSPHSATLAVTDAAGNSANCVAQVTVIDDIGPNASCQDATVYLSSPTLMASAINNGSSTHCGPTALRIDGASSKTFTCADAAVSPVSVTLEVSDILGASDTCTASITVIDDIGPNASCQDATVYLSSPTLMASAIDDGSTVHCGPATLRIDGAASKTFTCTDAANSPVTVTLEVEDALGATDTCTANITVIDDIGPSAHCKDATVYLSSPTLAAADLDLGSSVHCGPMTLLADGLPTRTFACMEVTASPVEVTFEVRDALGGVDTCTANVTVIDDIGIEALCNNITVNLSAPTITGADLDAGSSVGCEPMTLYVDWAASATFTCADAASSPVSVVFGVEDAYGDTAACIAQVTVIDDIGPSAACQDATVYLSAPTLMASALDNGSTVNCGPATLLIDGAPSRTFTCADVTASPVAVTFTVRDALGAEDTCPANITVIDDIGPAALCQSITVNLSEPSITPADIDAGSSVACGPMTLTIDGTDSLTFTCADVAASPLSVTLGVEDGFGQSAQCLAEVTVVDDVGPVAVPQPVTVNLSSPTITPADVDGGSTVECGPMTLRVNGESSRTFTCLDLDMAPLSVTLSVEDGYGVTDTVLVPITLIDDIPPVAICEDAEVVVNGALGVAEIVPELLGAASTDNCRLGAFSAVPATIPANQLGVHAVELTVTDASGNPDTCTANVNVLPPLSVEYTGPTDTPGGNKATIVLGEPYSFRVAVSGGIVGTLNYQWKYEAPAEKAFTDIIGETQPTYTIDAVTFETAGTYLCEVWDDLNVGQSPAITLVVNQGLPAAGVFGLGLLALALAGAGQSLLRRKSR